MGETFAKWDATDSLKTEEDAMFYLEACIDEDEGDGRLILAGSERNSSQAQHEPACAGSRNKPGRAVQDPV